MVMATRSPQGARLNPQNTLEISQGMSIQEALNTAGAHGGLWTILVYPGIYDEGDLTPPATAVVTIKGIVENGVYIMPAAAPITAVVNMNDTLHLENIFVIAPDATRPAVLVNTAAGVPSINRCTIVGVAGGYSLQMIQGALDAHQTGFSEDVHLSTARCLLDCYECNFFGDIITAAEALNHDIGLINCDMTQGNITSNATGATVISASHTGDIATVTNAGTGLFQFRDCYIDAVSVTNAAGAITCRGGTINNFGGTTGTILWYMAEGYMRVLARTSNDHINIQAALDALPATGGEVLLLEGTYNITTNIVMDSYQTLRGSGRNTILFAPSYVANLIVATGGDGTEKIGITISDLYLSGNWDADYGIRWTYVDKSKITNVWIHQCDVSAIYLLTSDYNEILGNYLSTNREGIYLYTSCYNSITGNYCETTMDAAIYLSENANYNAITGNVCRANEVGIELMYSFYCTVAGNTCIDNAAGVKTGVYLESAERNTISGNSCKGNGYGINLSYSHRNTVIGNAIHENVEDGLQVDHGDYNIVEGNIIHTNGENGIRLYYADQNSIISNHCYENSQTTDATYDNIFLLVSDHNFIATNFCRQGGLANKPSYGINISAANCDDNTVCNNDLHDSGSTANFNDAGTRTIVKPDNLEIEITQVKDYVYIKNTSGGASAVGDVVRHKAVAAGNEYDTPTANGEGPVLGMVAEVIANNASGLVQIGGKTTVLKATNAGGNIAIGDYLCTENGVRARLAAAGDMTFARALEACAAANCTTDALIISPMKI